MRRKGLNFTFLLTNEILKVQHGCLLSPIYFETPLRPPLPQWNMVVVAWWWGDAFLFGADGRENRENSVWADQLKSKLPWKLILTDNLNLFWKDEMAKVQVSGCTPHYSDFCFPLIVMRYFMLAYYSIPVYNIEACGWHNRNIFPESFCQCSPAHHKSLTAV